jgi:hypothetical protein
MAESLVPYNEIETLAAARHAALSGDAARRSRLYENLHRFYAPADNDQWPEDRLKRPNKFHVTANMVQAFVDIEARILSIMPKISNKPPVENADMRQKAEIKEKLYARFMDDDDFEVLFGDFNQIKSLYGRGALKAYWDDTLDPGRPGVSVVEQPQNLILGWNGSDFKVLDWAMYEYKISPLEAHLRYPEIEVLPSVKGKELEIMNIARGAGDHSDPLDQRSAIGGTNPTLPTSNSFKRRFVESDYDNKQVVVWDYWYKDDEGTVCNAQLVQGRLAADVARHPELPVLPYVVAENAHEPGSPEGRSTAEYLLDLQMVLNYVLSLWTQVVADDTEPAWQLTGQDAPDDVPAGVVARAGQITAPGAGNKIEKIDKNINQYPAQLLIQEIWNTAHRITGISEIMFGNAAASVDSARVLATQIEAAQNRLDPKRKRTYAAVRQVFRIWDAMIEHKNPEIEVGITPAATAPGETPAAETQKIPLGTYLKGLNYWDIVPPEITPRDSIENTNNIINQVTSNMLPRIKGMDLIGIDSPEENMAIMLKELANPRLNPAAVQQFAAVLQLLQSIQQQALAQQQAQGAPGAPGGGDPAANAAGATDQLLASQQAGAPTGMEDQNSPATGINSAPPPGAGVPGGVGTFQPLVRQTPGGSAQSLSQIKLAERRF